MVFSDLFFLFAFLPAFIACYVMAAAVEKGNALKNAVLVAFSLLFYAWGEPVYVFLMLACVVANYFFGLGVSRARRWRKLTLALGIAANIAVLGVFKYAGFIASTLCSWGLPMGVPDIPLPIGISFYVFQSISYLVDVHRRESPVQRSFPNLLLYISMFPQLIAGPIVRYGTIAHEITHRRTSADDVAAGMTRFMIGLAKKVILANQLSEISDLLLDNNLSQLTTTGAWIGIVAFTLQIYYDFSGYSDMAIGIGRCLGFHFLENFNHPYCCRTITDFWRRWHISLGSFFRDYVYIPMGGNRRHQAVNILTVWLLTGLWHGASWNFVIWGAYFGIIVMVEKYTILKLRSRLLTPLLHLYSLLFVTAGWGIFYFDDFASLHTFFNAFFGMAPTFTNFVSESVLTDRFWLWAVALVFCMPLRSWADRLLHKLTGRHTAAYNAMLFVSRLSFSLVALAACIALLVGATNNAFIYTRF